MSNELYQGYELIDEWNESEPAILMFDVPFASVGVEASITYKYGEARFYLESHSTPQPYLGIETAGSKDKFGYYDVGGFMPKQTGPLTYKGRIPYERASHRVLSTLIV